MGTKIEWTEETWNPVTGCTKVSAGCLNCYAERMAKRLAGRYGYPADEPFQVMTHPDRLSRPLHWKKPRRVFVCSMGDLFHEAVPGTFIWRVFDVMAEAKEHTFQVLTKRPSVMRSWVRRNWREWMTPKERPMPNVWLGASVENQKQAHRRIPELLRTPSPVRFLSMEPLLEPVNLDGKFTTTPNPWTGEVMTLSWLDCWGLDWVIVGCESGPNRRPMKLGWARDLLAQCREAGVPAFVKQLPINGRVSHDPAEWPEDLRVREFPND